MKSSYSQSQMDQKNYLEEIRFWEHPPWSGIVQNEERNKKFFNENKTDSSPTPHQDDSTREDVEAQHDFLSITRDFIYRHHVEPRVKLYMPREESFPFPLWKLSTLPETLINHWMYFWRKNWWSLERGWRKRIIRCVDRIHKIRSTLGKATRRMHMVREETYGETNNLSSWWCVARYVEIYVRCSEKESKTKMDYRETKARQCQTTERNILHWTKRRRIQAHNESRW